MRLNERILHRAGRGFDESDVVLVLVREALQRRIAHLHGKHPPAHLYDRRTAKGRAEGARVYRRRRDDQLQVSTPRQQVLQTAEEEVYVQRPLVGLIQNDSRVTPQQRIALQLREQDAVGHELEHRLARGVVIEAHLAAHLPAPLRAEFLRHAPGNTHSRHAPRLRAADDPALTEARLQAHLRQLRRLPRTRLPRHDDDLMRPQRGEDVLTALRDRKVGGIADSLHERGRGS